MQSSVPKNFNPEPFPYHHELDLRVDSLSHLGVGIARVDDWVVMIPQALPGERVRARIFRNHRNYSEADLLEILEASDKRVAAPCPYFGDCGGCQYQHLQYTEQLTWKSRHVAENLRKIAGIEAEVRPPIHAEPIYHYRSKITPHHQKPRKGEIQAIGFLSATHRNRIVDVERCMITTDAINDRYLEERGRIRQLAAKGKMKKGSTLLLRESMEGVTTDHKQVVTERVGERLFQFKAGDFFQNNPHVLPKMVEYVVAEAASGSLPYLIDTYCGSGLFSISASAHFTSCLGIEISDSSVQWARANAGLNQIKNCAYLVGDAAAIFEQVNFDPDQCVVIIDPPRRGCDESFLRQLSAFKPARLVYVSCDPATQARDTVQLMQFGYDIRAVQPVDLFPQTRHIENIITYERNK